jgi:hypothetical protein
MSFRPGDIDRLGKAPGFDETMERHAIHRLPRAEIDLLNLRILGERGGGAGQNAPADL